MSILDYLFPKYCVVCKKLGDYLCTDCFSLVSFNIRRICLICKRTSVDGLTHSDCKSEFSIDGVFSSLLYVGVTKRLIKTFKDRPYISNLQHLLSDLFYEGLIQQEKFHKVLNSKCILIPMPIVKEKYRERSYNQCEILAKNLSKRLNLPVISLLNEFELKHFNSNKYEKIIKDRIKRADLKLINNVILVCDVVETGFSILEAANFLKISGFRKVWGIALAQKIR